MVKGIKCNRGQMETFGLVIIVIIILFVGIFALQFMIKPKQGLDEDYLKLEANSLRNSVLKYSLCNGVDVKKEIYNCEELDYNECVDCNELKNVIIDIIEKSLDNPKINYGFKAGDIDLERGTCNDMIYASSEKFVNSDLKVEFYLC